MRAALIENGLVTNVIEVEDLDFMPGLVDASAGGSIGDQYVDGQLSPVVPVMTKDQHNAPILSQLSIIDSKSIRALREGDTQRIADLESQAAALRLQLIK